MAVVLWHMDAVAHFTCALALWAWRRRKNGLSGDLVTHTKRRCKSNQDLSPASSTPGGDLQRVPLDLLSDPDRPWIALVISTVSLIDERGQSLNHWLLEKLWGEPLGGYVRHSLSACVERLLREGGNPGRTRRKETPLVDAGHPPGLWQLLHDGQRRRGDNGAMDLCLRLLERNTQDDRCRDACRKDSRPILHNCSQHDHAP